MRSKSEENALIAALETAASMGAESVVAALKSVAWANRDKCDRAIAYAYAKSNRSKELGRHLAQRQDWSRLMSGDYGLASIVRCDSAACVEALLEAGLSPDDKSGEYDFPLLSAAIYESVACIKVLARGGVDLNWRNGEEASALGLAAHLPNSEGDGRWKSVKALLAAGADPNVPSGARGRTPLMLACVSKHAKIARMLLAAGAEFDAADREGRTALMWSASSGSLACVKLLLAAGCSIDGVDANGECGESWARKCGHEDCADAVGRERARREKLAMKAQMGPCARRRPRVRSRSL